MSRNQLRGWILPALGIQCGRSDGAKRYEDILRWRDSVLPQKFIDLKNQHEESVYFKRTFVSRTCCKDGDTVGRWLLLTLKHISYTRIGRVFLHKCANAALPGSCFSCFTWLFIQWKSIAAVFAAQCSGLMLTLVRA